MSKNQIAKRKNYDVVIIGAGPAGLAAAKVLASHGKSVLILEKNVEIGEKVCAGGLTVKDFDLGIDKKLAERTFSKVIITTPISSDEIESETPFLATVNRRKLGQYMLKEATQAGAEIKNPVEVLKITEKSVETDDGSEYGYRFLIGADGSSSLARKYLDVDKDKVVAAFHYVIPKKFGDVEFIFDADLFGSGYAWIFPSQDYTSVGCGADTKKLVDGAELQSNFALWFQQRFADLSLEDYQRKSWMINYDYRGHEFGNIFLAGDAAGFPSGITGEGIYYAMVSGQEIAKRILEPGYEQVEIAEILARKKKQEDYLEMMNLSETLTQLEYDALSLMLKSKIFDRKLIENFG